MPSPCITYNHSNSSSSTFIGRVSIDFEPPFWWWRPATQVSHTFSLDPQTIKIMRLFSFSSQFLHQMVKHNNHFFNLFRLSMYKSVSVIPVDIEKEYTEKQKSILHPFLGSIALFLVQCTVELSLPYWKLSNYPTGNPICSRRPKL